MVVPELGAARSSLLHDDGVAELGEETVDSLDRSVGNLTALGGAVKTPGLANLCINKVGDVLGVSKAHEGMSNVQLCAKVNAQVTEVIMAEGALVEPLLQIVRVDAVGDAAQHNSCARNVEEREEDQDSDDDPSQRSEVGVIHCIHHLVEIDDGIHDMLAGLRFRVVDLGVRTSTPAPAVTELESLVCRQRTSKFD